MKKLKHYNLVEKIASGGMGEVYKAFDTVLEREVAIKIMHRHLMDSCSNSERFLREARIAAKLVHPNVVTIYEVGETDAGSYIAMELVKGIPLSGLLRKEGVFKAENAIEIARQVLSGIQAAHDLGILHRDIKPDNILISENGQAKILDFGIAKTSATEGLTVAGDLLGTVEFMAPEQLLGEVLDNRCVIYAFGVVLYKMLTNELPFTSESAAAILFKQLNEDPLPPSFHNGKIGKQLDQAVLKTISKDRDTRWEKASILSEELDHILKTEVSVPTHENLAEDEEANTFDESLLISGAYSDPARLGTFFVGRDDELKKLTNVFSHVLRGQGQAVILKGEAGVGKSTLADRLKKYAELNQAWVLYGACLYQDGMDAYLPYIDALRSFFNKEGDSLSDQERLVLKDKVREEVPLLLEFTDRFVTKTGGKVELKESDNKKTNLLDGIYQLVSHLASIRPVVLVIDDLQWADEASLRLFHYLSRFVSGSRFLLMGISRTDHHDLLREGKPAPVVDVLARMRREGTCTEIAINRLTRESCDKMVDKALSPSLFTEEFYQRIYNETKGNPLFIGETLKLLCENGAVYFDDGHWVHGDDDFEIVVPHRVEDIFIRRLNELGNEEREMLQVLAVQGYKFDTSVACKLLEVKKIELLRTLQRIERELHIISGTDTGYQFEHPMLRDLLYNDIPPALRSEYHLMYAEEFTQIYGSNFGALVGDVARHFRRGGNHVRAIPLLFKAGMRAFELSAYREASLFFEDLLDSVNNSDKLVPQSVSESELYFKLGICYEESGRWEEALDTYNKLLKISENENELRKQADALLRIGRVYGKLSDWPTALSAYDKCLQLAVEHKLSNVLSRIYNNIGIICFQKGDFDAAEQHFKLTIQAVDSESGEFDEAHALTNMGIIQNIRGEHAAALENYKKALEIYERKGNRHQDEGRIHHNLGMTYADQGELDQAIEAFERCLKLADEVEDRQLHALSYLNIGKTYVRQNKLNKAKEYTEKALKSFKRMGDTINMAEVYHIFGLIHSEKKNFSVAEKFFVASIGINEKVEYQEGLAETYKSYANLCVKQGEIERARNCYQKSSEAYLKLELTHKANEIALLIDELCNDSEKIVKVPHVNEIPTHKKNKTIVHHS